MNRRDFIKGLAAAAAVAMVPVKWIGAKIHDMYHVTEIRYWDRRLSDDELEAMSKGIFPNE